MPDRDKADHVAALLRSRGWHLVEERMVVMRVRAVDKLRQQISDREAQYQRGLLDCLDIVAGLPAQMMDEAGGNKENA